MYALMAAAFIVMTVGMTSILLFLGWQQHQIERREAQARQEAASRAQLARTASGTPTKSAPVG